MRNAPQVAPTHSGTISRLLRWRSALRTGGRLHRRHAVGSAAPRRRGAAEGRIRLEIDVMKLDHSRPRSPDEPTAPPLDGSITERALHQKCFRTTFGGYFHRDHIAFIARIIARSDSRTPFNVTSKSSSGLPISNLEGTCTSTWI
jgi:hypothetical protein